MAKVIMTPTSRALITLQRMERGWSPISIETSIPPHRDILYREFRPVIYSQNEIERGN